MAQLDVGRDGTNAGGAAAAGLAVGSPFPAYDPDARLELEVSEVDLRRNGAGRMLMARIYQPVGRGPFRRCSTCMAAPGTEGSGRGRAHGSRAGRERVLLVVAVDFTGLAPEAPYPASCRMPTRSVRWLKCESRRHGSGDLAPVGIYGASSGGHVAELLGMRPHDPATAQSRCRGAKLDATVA